jgi:23S rRNA (pseudouridine1915-N3)-methyltransferase
MWYSVYMARKISILVTGKSHDQNLRAAIEEYEKRLAPYLAVHWQILPPKNEATSSQSVASECKATLRSLKEAEYVILLDETGPALSSEQFSELVMGTLGTQKDVAIIIGGAYGVSDEVKKRANATVSFGKMVLPHQIMRLVLIEQLYRAVSIHNGNDYHHS